MAALISEIVYRGIFQKNLASRIARGIVLSARKSGRWGIAFGRYGDSPQRNGIPAKDFAIVADTNEELEQNMARYEPKHVDITVCVDDTLAKGVESWAWYGLQPRDVKPTEGNAEIPYSFEMPKWWEMREGVTIPAIPVGKPKEDGKGYVPERNPYFKKFTTRTMRPVVNFDTCVKCTLCWIQCPDSCFDVMPDGPYDANMEACCGCGVCEAVSPVENCIAMVSEEDFDAREREWVV